MTGIFNNYIYEPMLSVLIFIHQNIAFGDLGIAIIILTLFVRIVLFPIFWKSAKDQAVMARLQPHIKKIQLDHKDNQEEQAKRMMALYREHRLNPLSGFLLLLLQLPILIAIYQIFLHEITVDVFGTLSFLGILDLSERSIVLAIAAAALQYFQTKLSLPKRSKSKEEGFLAQIAGAGRMMAVIGPVVTFAILMNFPSALGLYWTTSVLFSLGQQVIINRKLPKLEDDGEHGGKN
ncbi:MAG: YidC/Oxa1 family membrane protein insertase [Candidatus Jorgensenbacteria bacterium]